MWGKRRFSAQQVENYSCFQTPARGPLGICAFSLRISVGPFSFSQELQECRVGAPPFPVCQG